MIVFDFAKEIEKAVRPLWEWFETVDPDGVYHGKDPEKYVPETAQLLAAYHSRQTFLYDLLEYTNDAAGENAEKYAERNRIFDALLETIGTGRYHGSTT